MVAAASIKAALVLAWDDPRAQPQALTRRLDALTAVAQWLAPPPASAAVAPRVSARVAVAHHVRAQDCLTASHGTPMLRHGVAADRRIRGEDAEMRHGRKSRSLLVDGSKRHVLRELESRLIVAVGVTPAKAPAARVTDASASDLAAQKHPLQAWHIDRASLARTLMQQRAEERASCCQAWPVRQGPYGPTSAVALDWRRQALQCPGGVTMPCEPGGIVKFPAAICAGCALRPRCTTRAAGRRVRMHPDEALW